MKTVDSEFKNDLKDGYGIYYYINGNRYEGQWKNDAKKGYGIFLTTMLEEAEN